MASSDTRTPAEGNARDGAPMVAARSGRPWGREAARTRRNRGLGDGVGPGICLVPWVVVIRRQWLVVVRRSRGAEPAHALPGDERTECRDREQRDEPAGPVGATEP